MIEKQKRTHWKRSQVDSNSGPHSQKFNNKGVRNLSLLRFFNPSHLLKEEACRLCHCLGRGVEKPTAHLMKKEEEAIVARLARRFFF